MYCMSMSHKKAPVAIREKFAFGEEEKKALIDLLKKAEEVTGCVVLCTCNRSEMYISGGKNAIVTLQKAAAKLKKLSQEELLNYLNIYSGEKAAAHLFKVCCGFDSMVLGEDEILGQVKAAYQMTLDCHFADYELNVLFQKAIACAKRIKTNTELSRTPLSIATLVANEVFHFEKEGMKQVMVIGISGKMGSTITKNLLSKPEIRVTGTVRAHRPEFLMLFDGHREGDPPIKSRGDQVRLVNYEDRYQYMDQMDLVISATSGPHYTVTYGGLAPELRTKKKRLFIDVAVPVDMDPKIREIEDAALYDIDYFDALSRNNSQIKMRELDRARAIMEEDLDAAIKEVLMHPYILRMKELKERFAGKKLDTLLFRIRDHVTSEELKVVLNTLDGLEIWLKEGG